MRSGLILHVRLVVAVKATAKTVWFFVGKGGRIPMIVPQGPYVPKPIPPFPTKNQSEKEYDSQPREAKVTSGTMKRSSSPQYKGRDNWNRVRGLYYAVILIRSPPKLYR